MLWKVLCGPTSWITARCMVNIDVSGWKIRSELDMELERGE
jgi:hypothetical protein